MRSLPELLVTLCLGLGLGTSALAQALPSGRDMAPLVAAYEARIAALQELQRLLPPPANLEEALQRRLALDGAIRDGREMAGLSMPDRYALQAAIDPTSRRIEAENVAFLKAVLPAEGWFRLSRDGSGVASKAWVIVQHAPEHRAWQKEILAKMELLVPQGEVNPMSYGMLYDRVHLHETGKQRFGSQTVCRDGRMTIAAMDEPEKVQERRDAIRWKMPPFEEFTAFVSTQRC
jgi:hypothetical protein